MKIKIPKTFQLFGQTITVEFVSHLTSENGTLGEARIGQNKIVIQANVDGKKMSSEQSEWVFIHELTHMVLHHMGQEDLCEDEQFVDTFAKLLHQSFKTMTF